MSLVIDSHVHTFPYLGGASGFPTIEEHMNMFQRGLYFAVNPTRRRRDNSVVPGQTLWNGEGAGPEGLADVGLRIGRCGQIDWSTAGEGLYLQYFAPSLENQASSPEYMVAEMNYAGVDVAVLQNAPMYGVLNDFFADCLRKYPKRFIGLGHVWEASAHTDEQLSELDRCANALGLGGIFYSMMGFWMGGYRDNLDDAKYRPFWEEIRRLQMVVFWDANGFGSNTAESYSDQLHRICQVHERHAGIAGVLVQAFPLSFYGREGRYVLPDAAYTLGELPGFCFELAYPISNGREWEYPYPETWPFIHQLYDHFGPERLVWGSDMPNVLRFCTYGQSHQFLRHCNFLSDQDLGLILGRNVARLFHMGA